VIERVISGGQTGSDQAGWRAAAKWGIATSGWMTKGFRTEDGGRPDFAATYGARETESRDYPERTRRNAMEADRTLWFGDPTSRGGVLTLRSCGGLPLIIHPPNPKYAWSVAKVARWLAEPAPGCKVLNVAGSRESKHPGIGTSTESFLVAVFMMMKYHVGQVDAEGLP
jgi:hypothetical protein